MIGKMIVVGMLGGCLSFGAGVSAATAAPDPVATNAPPRPILELPMGRTAHFLGERVPVSFAGCPTDRDLRFEAVNADGRTLLYSGKPANLFLDTTKLAPGDYALEVNGLPVLKRLTLTSPLRKSAGSMQDESMPGLSPQFEPGKKYTPEESRAAIEAHWDSINQIFRESGLSACFSFGSYDMGRDTLDTMARSGAIMLVNEDTRPTSFNPVGNNPDEIDGMSQRMILAAQANGRYPNFGGFCFGWDTCGFAVGGRRMLLIYWAWHDQTEALRSYIERMDAHKMEEFTKRTGMKPVTEEEYIAYLLSIKRPEFATAIDVPTKVWLDELARYVKPLPEAELKAFDKRLEAWSNYLMNLYRECYTAYMKNLASVDPAMRHTSSVQSDHCVVRNGQYFPSAYEPLDFRYQSTWNDQIGGPDYLCQWLLVDALLEMGRGDKPVWISNAIGPAHDRAMFPGKFARVAAHGLAFGASGIGFAYEGFSNILGGMNPATRWRNMKSLAGEADVLAGREFLDRFAALAVEGRGDHVVGILWSKTQYGRQHIGMGYGTAAYQALVALTRLGYTPRFVTEEEIEAGKANDVKALVIIGQTFPLPAKVTAGLEAFRKNGGRILADGSTAVAIAGAEKLDHVFPFSEPGKPQNWASPNMIRGENDTILYERRHPALAQAFSAALGGAGHAILQSEKGAETKVSLLQIDGGRDARYIVAVNDSWVATQTDWHQVKETLAPSRKSDETSALYDCTDEKALGKLAPVECDLSSTIARVYAVLSREIASPALSADQATRAGGNLDVVVAFKDASGKPLEAVIPFHLTLIRPDGRIHQEFYRSTTRAGRFAMRLPVPLNAPAGHWTVAVRCQLTGDVASLPVDVAAAKRKDIASVWDAPVVTRQKKVIEEALHKGATVVLPIFDSTNAAALRPAADKVKAVLAKRGVEVEIWDRPATGTYWLAYAPTDDQKRENERTDKGEIIGRLSRTTVNGNDWFSSLSGWRFPRTVILLDIAGKNGDNPMAEPLEAYGLLWPAVSATFPGPGKAVVQAVQWAFAPRETAVVIQAADEAGLMAGAESLARLPEDILTAPIQAVKDEIWRQYYIGSRPAPAEIGKCASKGLTVKREPKPFAIAFPKDRPPPADQVKHPQPTELAAKAVPAEFMPADYVLHYRVGEKFVETETVGFLMPDLRFSEAVMLVAEVKQAGKMKIAAEGVFRYSDRTPCRQAQWEDIINLREKLIPKERRPVEFEVQVNGKPAGKLVAVKTDQKEVPLEKANKNVAIKAKTSVEEVVTEAAGEIELAAGRQEILLIHKNIVDGTLNKVRVGQ